MVTRSVRRFTPAGSVAVVTLVLIAAAGRSDRTDPQIVALLLVAAATLLAMAVVGATVSIRRVRVAVRSVSDAVVGDEVALDVTISGSCPALSVRVREPDGPWHRGAAPWSGPLLHRADRRGVFGGVGLEVRTAWPLGLFQVGRNFVVELDRLVYVAPRPSAEEPVLLPVPDGLASVAGSVAAPSSGEQARSVRPYVAGDAPRLVHWPTTARRGELVVRELEPPVRVGAVIVVDLRGPAEGVEAAASRAAGLVLATLRAGGEVLLATFELDGPVLAPVSDPRVAGRRLARAVPGPPPDPPAGWPVVRVQP